MPIYRIRRYWGIKGGSNHYSHADVIAKNSRLAMKAAEEGRACNWRHIDEFDIAPQDYDKFELLGPIGTEDAKNPEKPIPFRLHRKIINLEKKILAMDGVESAGISTCDAVVILKRRSWKLRREIDALIHQVIQLQKVRFYYPEARTA